MGQIVTLSVRLLSDQALRNAIEDTQAVLAEPLLNVEREEEIARLRILVEDLRRRGLSF